MPVFTAFQNTDIQGLNDNLLLALSGGIPGTGLATEATLLQVRDNLTTGGNSAAVLLALINTNAGNIATYTNNTVTELSNILAKLNGSIQVKGKLISSDINLTRPANVTAYTALDAVSDSTSAPTVLTFANIVTTAGDTGYITKALIVTDQSTNIARFKLHLFNTAPTAINDNAAQTILYANRATYIGYISWNACGTEGTGSDCAYSLADTLRLAFTSGATTSLFGLLETLDGFTPASGQKFYIKLLNDANG